VRVLVLGGTQLIGRAAVHELVALGHQVAVFHRGRTQGDLPTAVQYLRGDRRQLVEHQAALRAFQPDVVVDMLAFTEGDAKSLIAAFQGYAGRTVVISSIDVYRAFGLLTGVERGEPELGRITEDSALRTVRYPYRTVDTDPGSFGYHYDKILVEQAASDTPDLPCTVLRLPMVYGPGDYQHRVAPYLRRMDDQRPAILLGEAMATWRGARAYVDDAGHAIALAATDATATGRIYHLADDPVLPERAFVDAVAAAAGWRGRIVTVPDRRLPDSLYVAQDLDVDSTRIRQELGYTETLPAREALMRTTAWERAFLRDHAPDYTQEDALIVEFGRP